MSEGTASIIPINTRLNLLHIYANSKIHLIFVKFSDKHLASLHDYYGVNNETE